METISDDDPLVGQLRTAIEAGDLDALKKILDDNPRIGSVRIEHEDGLGTFLHVATNWPGHFPNVAQTIAMLIEGC